MREEHGLISRASADLEHLLLSRKLEQLEIARVYPRLRDRLPVPDGQWRILVRAMPQAGWHECVARRHLDRPKHCEIANPLLAQRIDEALARAAELRVYRSRHQVAAS